MIAINHLQFTDYLHITSHMSMQNDDQTQSLMEKISASQLPVSDNPNKTTKVLSRSDSRYWLEPKRLFKNRGSSEYACRFSIGGKRPHFVLGTANKKTAAAKAAEIYAYVQSHGWEATLEHYKPKTTKSNDLITVGEIIKAASQVSTARSQSLNAYVKAFRKIVSDIKNIPGTGKHVASGSSSAEWRNKVDAVDLASLTPADVIIWKTKRLREAEADPMAKRRAIVTVNSLIRNAKSLFGKKILPFVEEPLKLPTPLPFDGVTLEKAPSMRYTSKIDPYALLATAKDELAESDPEAFKALILALVCGLRRSEIDNLLWRAFDFPGSALRVEASEFHQLKSEDSAGTIDLDADTLALFRGYRAKHPKSIFVIESTKKPNNQIKSRGYRCDEAFKKLLTWLRGQGVEGNKPIHTLRKEIGSIIASEHGIFEASRYLRHSDIRITSAIYADKKKIVTPMTFVGLLGAKKIEDQTEGEESGLKNDTRSDSMTTDDTN